VFISFAKKKTKKKKRLVTNENMKIAPMHSAATQRLAVGHYSYNLKTF